MRFVKAGCILLLTALSLASASGAPKQAPAAAQGCLSGPCSIFLPVVSYDITASLLSPFQEQQITTVAPTLSWRPRALGVHKIQLTADPSFNSATLALDTTKTVRSPVPDQIDTLLTFNLEPLTNYYWRIGVPTPSGYIYPVVQSFFTPAAEALSLPPPPALITPPNNVRLSATTIKFTWQPIPGALYYRVRVYYPNGDRFFSDEVAGTSVEIGGLTKGTTFHWRVRAENGSGWGDYSPDYFFTIK
jgi:hypothetical protein